MVLVWREKGVLTRARLLDASQDLDDTGFVAVESGVIAHAGRNPGVTSASVNLKLIWDVISAIKVGETGHAFVLDGPGHLQLPRPDLAHAFVLKPLFDLAPELRLPTTGQSLAELWAAHPGRGLTRDPLVLG